MAAATMRAAMVCKAAGEQRLRCAEPTSKDLVAVQSAELSSESKFGRGRLLWRFAGEERRPTAAMILNRRNVDCNAVSLERDFRAQDDEQQPETDEGLLGFVVADEVFKTVSALCSRRGIIGAGIALLISSMSLPSRAIEEDFSLYQDRENKFSLLIPHEWEKGEGSAGLRKVTAFSPDKDTSANVNIIITDLGADYTALGSFGSADAFAENLVNSMDRAWKKPKGQAAKLIDSRAKNGMYYIEYTVQKPGEAKRHLLSVVGIGSNGWINRLYTVTGQYWEDDNQKYKTSLEKSISSFRLT